MTFPNALRGATEIKSLAAEIEGCITGPLNIMEVCGGHTHGIRRFGLNQLMPRGVRFSHGPGCPVCVMPKERIDQAIALARQDDVILVTFGDMMGVPGSAGSLTRARADGCDVRMVYSPMDSVKIAGENPEKKVVYFAIGFETTAPLTAAVVERVKGEGLDNVFFHINHVLVAPAMDAIMDARDVRVDAFIAPGHVSTITGWAIYREMAERYGTPLAHSLRVLSQESRDDRMLRAEEKAARLPALLTVPMIVFILPPLFIVLLGPAILDVMDNFSGVY